jgi:hypothetical protein
MRDRRGRRGWSGGEEAGDGRLDGERGLAGIGGVANGTAHHDVIGAVAEGAFDRRDALLIVGGRREARIGRPDTRRDDEQALAQALAQRLGLASRGDHAVATQFERAAAPRQHQAGNIDVVAEIPKIAAVEAGEHGDRQNFKISLIAAGRFHDAVIAMDGGEGDRAVAQPAHRGAHGFGDIEHLEIDENLLAAIDQPVHQLEVPACHAQLQAELVETHGISQALHQVARQRRLRHVEGKDQPVAGRNLLPRQERREAWGMSGAGGVG